MNELSSNIEEIEEIILAIDRTILNGPVTPVSPIWS